MVPRSEDEEAPQLVLGAAGFKHTLQRAAQGYSREQRAAQGVFTGLMQVHLDPEVLGCGFEGDRVVTTISAVLFFVSEQFRLLLLHHLVLEQI